MLAGAVGGQRDTSAARPKAPPANPFLADLEAARPAGQPVRDRPAGQPVPDARRRRRRTRIDNPFAPPPLGPPDGRDRRAAQAPAARPRPRGGGELRQGPAARTTSPTAYAQFGPLTAYPRAQRTRDLYPSLPDAPLPAVITCIATTAEARGAGLARALIAAVCDDLTARGFTAVETYPEIGARPGRDERRDTRVLGIGRLRSTAIADERFPVMRRDLA